MIAGWIVDGVQIIWLSGLTGSAVYLVKRGDPKPPEVKPNEIPSICPSCLGKWGKWGASATEKTTQYNPYGPDTKIWTTYQRRSCEECGYTEQRKIGTVKETGY